MRPPAVVLSLLLAVVVVAPVPAQADEVSQARDRVERLQDLARDTTSRLTDGTRRWEADKRALRKVELDLRNTQRHIAAAERTADEANSRVAGLARRLYMRPAADAFEVAFTKTPDDVIEALLVRRSLDLSAGSDATIVLRAKTAQGRLGAKEALAKQLSRQAHALAQGSERRMRDLQELAARTARQLEQAQAALSKARANKAARAARANRVRYSGGALCTNKSTDGQANGNLDPASLCPLWGAPGHRLRADAAAAFNAMSKHHAATRGGALCVSSSYRTYSEQAALYRQKPGLAAVPGSSNHGWGRAVDLCGGAQNFGTAEHEWLRANGPRFGWQNPDWARRGGSKPEAWHWEYGS